MSTAGPEKTIVHLPGDPASAGGARRFVSDALKAWGRTDLEEVATLLVSELVANVVLHAGTELDLRLRRAGTRVRVEVHDRSRRLPDRKYYSSTSATGRGMVLVDELSAAWGAEPTAEGKSVWFELDAPPSGARASATDGANVSLDDWDDLMEAAPPPPAHLAAPSRPSEARPRLRRRCRPAVLR